MRLVALALLVAAIAVPALSGAQAPAPDPERAAAMARVKDAFRQHDFKQAIAAEREWATRHPTDLEFREIEPLLYHLAGDEAGWEQARRDLVATWARIRDTAPPPPRAGFPIDIMKLNDQYQMLVQQCYERGGTFGVLYKFALVGKDNRTAAFFDVESADVDNEISRLKGQGPVFTLDYNRPNYHETAAIMKALPDYQELRRRVLAYIANPNPISASNPKGMATYGCEFAPRR
jgi:hypothetical protein